MEQQWWQGQGQNAFTAVLFSSPPPQNPSQFSAQLEIKQQQRMHSAIVAEKNEGKFPDGPIFELGGAAPAVQECSCRTNRQNGAANCPMKCY